MLFGTSSYILWHATQSLSLTLPLPRGSRKRRRRRGEHDQSPSLQRPKTKKRERETSFSFTMHLPLLPSLLLLQSRRPTNPSSSPPFPIPPCFFFPRNVRTSNVILFISFLLLPSLRVCGFGERGGEGEGGR